METNIIYGKMLHIQSEIGVIAKDKENPYFKSKYADINTLLDIIKPILTKNDVVITQPINYIDGQNVLSTVLTCIETGQHIESSIKLPENSDPQKYGAIITYFRRYGIVSLLAIQAEDTDGNDTTEKTVYTPENKSVVLGNAVPRRVGNKEIPTCSICHSPMKPTRPGAKTPFYCKHGAQWGKPVFLEDEISPKEQEFLDNLGVEV